MLKVSEMNITAGMWVASLPGEIEGRKILDVEFISPKNIDMEFWKPAFSFAHYTPESLLFKGSPAESVEAGFHLAKMQVEVQSTAADNLINVADEIIYPRICRAIHIVDIASRTGHIYVSPEVIFKLKSGSFSTWVGRSMGLPQGEPKEDLLELLEEVFSMCMNGSFLRRIERALDKWAEAQEEPREALRIAKLWTVLDALLQRKGESQETIIKRSIALVTMETRESIELFSIAGWRISFDLTNLKKELIEFLSEARKIRNAIYHDAEEFPSRIGFALDLTSLTQVLILKMVEIAQTGWTWKKAVTEIDKRLES